MPISFTSWPSDSSNQIRRTNRKIYEQSLAGSDGNGFFAITSNPPPAEGEYLDRLGNPGRYTGENRYRMEIANPYIIEPHQTKKPANLFDTLLDGIIPKKPEKPVNLFDRLFGDVAESGENAVRKTGKLLSDATESGSDVLKKAGKQLTDATGSVLQEVRKRRIHF